MVLFILLAIIAIIMIMVTMAVVSVGGAIGMILFSDVIVCIFIIGWIMKKMISKK